MAQEASSARDVALPAVRIPAIGCALHGAVHHLATCQSLDPALERRGPAAWCRAQLWRRWQP
jgi:hypothetical protein